jgi:Flp pilus assembly protein TadG
MMLKGLNGVRQVCRRALFAGRGFMADRQGGPAAEFALILVPMVFIFVLILQFGILLFLHNDMFNAARDTARELAANRLAQSTYASVDCGSQTQGWVEDVACDHLVLWSGVTTFTVQVDVTAAGSADVDCDQIDVAVSTPMDQATIFNIFGFLSGRDLIANMSIRSQHNIVDLSGVSVGTGVLCNFET